MVDTSDNKISLPHETPKAKEPIKAEQLQETSEQTEQKNEDIK
jgi:hypothetical protein